jgi:hypothetical protein
MGAALNNVATADDYTEANTLNCEGAVKLDIQVFNAAIYYSYMPRSRIHPRGGNFSPEVLLGPATYLLVRNADQVRVRSAASGVPAQVTIEALNPGE